jgi:hypothetical protein
MEINPHSLSEEILREGELCLIRGRPGKISNSGIVMLCPGEELFEDNLLRRARPA